MKKINKKNYKSRIIDSIIEKDLKLFGALCIEGPKWCGKTWTSSFHANSDFFVGDPTGNFSNRKLAEIEPYTVLNGDKPRLIDEWQDVPQLWDATRSFVDQTGKKGQLILTRSSTPVNKGVLHSGTGRIKSIRMHTMSLYESKDSSGLISLKDLINNKFEPRILKNTNLEELAYLIIRGGWPGNLDVNKKDCGELAISYVDNVIKTDLHKLDPDIDYSEHKAKLILKSLARNESTTVSNQTILNDIIENDETSISKNTLVKYLSAFNRMFLFNNIEPYSTNFRSSLRVKQSEKRHFSDPSLSAALLNLTVEKLMSDMNTFGFMFEALVERDLLIYAQSINAKLYHYQDYNGNEIDAVIELNDGNWCAIEIKLGIERVQAASNNLVRICNSIVKNGGKAPLIKCIIYGSGKNAYKDNNDVYIFPITALKD